MKVKLHEIPIREIADGYIDNAEEGVVGYGGRLNIRPKYQREFIYKEKERNAVIDTIVKGFPLNVMYWAGNGDGTFEVLDGQQRTISFCQYVFGDFSVESRAFHNLTKTEQEEILNYETMIYFCEGNEREKLDWFRIVNIAGVKLTDQELRNAVYTGPWLSNAKSIFSKSNCAAYQLSKNYVSGSPIRQEILQTALKWITGRDKTVIEDYMSQHQHDTDASELWQYFQNVIHWITVTFPYYRKEMKGLDWGRMFNTYRGNQYNAIQLEKDIKKLMLDDDIDHRGIYEYMLSGNEKHLNIRAFEDGMKRTAYERQKGICAICKKHFEIDEMEADHITPWHGGGKTVPENCQMLCRECNRRKSGK